MSDFNDFNMDFINGDFSYETTGFEQELPVENYAELEQIDFQQLLGEEINFPDEYSIPIDANNVTVFAESKNFETYTEQPQPPSPPKVREQFVYARDLPDQSYRHSVLGKFPSPTLPLRIIDHLGYPLPDHVVQALGDGLKQRLDQDAIDELERIFNEEPQTFPEQVPEEPEEPEESEEKPTPSTQSSQRPLQRIKPTADKAKPWVKPNRKTQGKNKRSANIANFDPQQVYDALPECPASWGTQKRLGQFPFRYTIEGELESDIKLTDEMVMEYLFQHPGHLATGAYNPKLSSLTLWIQCVPADSARRYPTSHSDKCRYVDCPTSGTIHKGHFRVALDEQSLAKGNFNLDPFHYAGFFHLYCLEKVIDFAQLCKDFNVMADDRHFRNEPQGINRMSITRDKVEMRNVVKEFIKKQPAWSDSNPYKYEETLSYKLTKEHLRLEHRARQATRIKRGGNSIDKHLNNLDLFVAGNKQRRAGQQSGENCETIAVATASKPAQKRKRSEVEDDDAEFEIDGGCFGEGIRASSR